MSKFHSSVVRAVVETMESRRLLSGVIQLGDGFALVAGGHGVSTNSNDVARYFARRDAISKTVEAPDDTSTPVLPSDAKPYTDPNNPNVIGIDKDGLIVQKPADDVEPNIPNGGIIRNSKAASVNASAVAVVPVGSVDSDGLVVQASTNRPVTFIEKPDADGIIRTKPVLGSDGFIRSKVILPDSLTGDRTVGNQPASVGGPFNINVVKGSGASGNAAVSAIIDAAAKYVESLFDDSITINIGFNYYNFGAGYENVIGSTGSEYIQKLRTDVVTKMKADNDPSTETIVDQIPSTPTFVTNNSSQFGIAGNSLLTAANGKALGYTSSFSLDAQIDFNSAFSFDTDPTNGTANSTKDMFSTVVHELFHAMGFDTAVDDEASVLADGTTPYPFYLGVRPLDMFRLKPTTSRPSFDTATRIITTGSAYATPVLYDGQFSTSGISGFGATLSTGDIPVSTGDGYYAGTSTLIGDGNQASHWKDDDYITRKIGIMDPTAFNGISTPAIVNNLRAIDQRMMGLIGWNVSSSGSVLSDNGILRINGTSAANSISSAVSTNSTGGKTFTTAISAGSTTVVGYFDNATVSGVSYDGMGGDDNITGSTRSETISGGTGNDTINGGDGNDSINGDDGADALLGGVGNDSLQGGTGNDSISGDDGDDSLRGDAGVDSLSGAAGTDRLDAFDNIVDLILKGGTGTDTAYYDNSPNEASIVSSDIESATPV